MFKSQKKEKDKEINPNVSKKKKKNPNSKNSHQNGPERFISMKTSNQVIKIIKGMAASKNNYLGK